MYKLFQTLDMWVKVVDQLQTIYQLQKPYISPKKKSLLNSLFCIFRNKFLASFNVFQNFKISTIYKKILLNVKHLNCTKILNRDAWASKPKKKKTFHNTSCCDKLWFDNDHAAGFYKIECTTQFWVTRFINNNAIFLFIST